MKKLIIIFTVLLSVSSLSAQFQISTKNNLSKGNTTIKPETKDTIKNPYFVSMMFDRSINFYQTVRAANLYFSAHSKGKGSGYKQFKRWEYFWRTRVSPSGEFPPVTQNIDAYNQFFSGPNFSQGGSWTSMGSLTTTYQYFIIGKWIRKNKLRSLSPYKSKYYLCRSSFWRIMENHKRR